MTQVEQIQSEIEALPREDFKRLREWFAEQDWLLRDQQLEADVAERASEKFAAVKTATIQTKSASADSPKIKDLLNRRRPVLFV